MLQNLYTSQGENIPDIPWNVYPRPQLRRDSFFNLNGYWDFTCSHSRNLPLNYPGVILVPFCPESLLSGLNTHFPEGEFLYYRRTFTLPEGFHKGRVLLHIGAADQELQCYVNNKFVGSHIGGYESMTFDITEQLRTENTLTIRCTDDLRKHTLPYGKQSLSRGGMWYTPVSGIWQTVWLESVPEKHIHKLNIENRGTSVTISVMPFLNGTVTVNGLGSFPLTAGKAVITPEKPHLWSPEDPYLYDFTVETETDRVQSYFALRTLDIQEVNGFPRLCLNGKPYFFHGLLDQGYFSDGIYTPAAPECYTQDIQTAKKLGFNTLRKHIKVEPEQFYYDCDRLGMIVFQDMVNNGDYSYFRDTVLPTIGLQKLADKTMHRNADTRQAFLNGMKATVEQLRNHPCIVYWTIFNEGWGQFAADEAYDTLQELDGTRFIDTTSGWFRQKKTDVESLHVYFGSWKGLKSGKKPLVLSEFGGYTYYVNGHVLNPKNSYGYKTCHTPGELQQEMEVLYRSKILPAIGKGLCAAIYTQLSDVEDEINGLVTYDRKITKVDEQAMQTLAKDLQSAIK